MREIKFRAWDEELKLMLKPVDLSQPLQYYKWLGRGDRPIMQYTGLKDKNGKEIYEGDIMKVNEDLTKMFYIKEIGIVTYLRGQFYADEDCVDLSGFSCLADMGGKFIRAEVIGNIYENPELLK